MHACAIIVYTMPCTYFYPALSVQKKRPVSVSLTKLYERIGVSPARLSGHARRKATSTTVVVRRNLLTELAKVKKKGSYKYIIIVHA